MFIVSNVGPSVYFLDVVACLHASGKNTCSRYDEQSVDPLIHVYLALQPSQMKDSASANFILLESYPGCTKLCKNISQSLSLDIFFLAAGTYLQFDLLCHHTLIDGFISDF